LRNAAKHWQEWFDCSEKKVFDGEILMCCKDRAGKDTEMRMNKIE